MRPVFNGKQAIAVLCGDVHASHEVPLARAETRHEWYHCQINYWKQLKDIMAVENQYLPVIIAGDIVHHWNSPPELINAMAKHFPRCLAIPGQHDLPNHNLDELQRSAFWSLVKCGTIHYLDKEDYFQTHHYIHPFPWGRKVTPPVCPKNIYFNIAVIHDYVWSESTGYDGAPAKKETGPWSERLEGYDIALFGDNHKTVQAQWQRLHIFNAGTFMRRKSDERNHRPCVGILYTTGEIERRYINCAGDQWREEADLIESSLIDIDPKDVQAALNSLADVGVNFSQAIVTAANSLGKMSSKTRGILLTIAENVNEQTTR